MTIQILVLVSGSIYLYFTSWFADSQCIPEQFWFPFLSAGQTKTNLIYVTVYRRVAEWTTSVFPHPQTINI